MQPHHHRQASLRLGAWGEYVEIEAVFVEGARVAAALQREAPFLGAGVTHFGGVAGVCPGERRLRRAPAQRTDGWRCIGQASEDCDLLGLRAGNAARFSVNEWSGKRGCRRSANMV